MAKYQSNFEELDGKSIYVPSDDSNNKATVFTDAVEQFEAEKNKEPEYITKIKAYLGHTGITDIHVTEGKPLVLRINGDICRTKTIVGKDGITEITDKIFQLPGYDRFNCSGEYNGYRVRLRVSHALQKKQLFIRVLPGRAPDIDRMGYGEFLREKLLDAPRTPGIVIVAGSTGSGKSTMLASVLQYFLDTRRIHIVSAEDPVEYILYDNKGIISQREIPDDIDGFHDAVINALREDPDIIFIGETRDSATAIALLQASETGHLAFTTIHAPDIPGIIGRLKGLLADTVDVDMRLAQIIKGCIYLTLKENEDGGYFRTASVLWFDEETKNILREQKNYSILQNYVREYRINSSELIGGTPA
jgi:twitching motility protein PilT